MSEPLHHAFNRQKSEHGTTASYVVGFALSLVFTVIPYLLVTHKTVAGNALLVTILGVAVLQMCIQIFFFLHLGRGPKPLYNVVFFVSTITIILIVVGGSIFIMNNLYRLMAPIEVTTKLAQDEGIAQVNGASTGACQEIGVAHKVTIQNDTVTPAHTEARRCDSLTFINLDDKAHDMTFGLHAQQQPYGGELDATVRKDYPNTITLNQSGTYSFQDSLNPDITGDFTVTP